MFEPPRAIRQNWAGRLSVLLLAAPVLFTSCGGSSSETPFPAPPVPAYVKQRVHSPKESPTQGKHPKAAEKPSPAGSGAPSSLQTTGPGRVEPAPAAEAAPESEL
ncbi:MAG: hypothetical protein RJA70_1377 [Pseudomonadota bacterium]|jgi:hypothetical protein